MTYYSEQVLSSRSVSVYGTPAVNEALHLPTGSVLTTMHVAAGPRGGVRSVDEASRLLSCFSAFEPALGVSELAGKLAVPRSKVHRYLVSLEQAGMVRRDPASRRYMLGPRLVALGQIAASGIDVISVLDRRAAPEAIRLGRTLVVSILMDDALTNVRQYDSGDPASVLLRPGQVPIATTAQGMLFLAYLPDTEVADLVRRLNIDRDTLAEAAMVRKTGIAGARGQFMTGISAVAAPVFDHTGRIAAGLAAVDISERMPDDAIAIVGPQLVEIARIASRDLGHLGPFPGDDRP